MESVKICKACGTENSIGDPLCQRCAAADFELSASGVRDSLADNAPRSSALESRQVVVEWPWANRDIVGRLAVGRDETFSPIAPYMSDYDNVSRCHAELIVIDGNPTVRDLDSTNGTFVNGTRIAAATPVTLRDGDEVRFGRDLAARIRITAE